jgi:hypothetical protein
MNIISRILIMRLERQINGHMIMRKFSDKINNCKNIKKDKNIKNNKTKSEELITRSFIDKKNTTNDDNDLLHLLFKNKK